MISNSQLVADILKKPRARIHLAGVCGVGMAGLANLLKVRGFEVSGCDLNPNSMAEWLGTRGIKVLAGHDAAHIGDGLDCLIISAALSCDIDEVRSARERGIPVFYRGEILPELLPGYFSIAVCGTHGKTSTAFFAAQVLSESGQDPSWCIGGEMAESIGASGHGDGNIMVVEADESDGTVRNYHPDIAVITNIEFDHMEHFADENDFKECFKELINNARRKVVYCADDPICVKLVEDAKKKTGCKERFISYGLTKGAQIRASHVERTDKGHSFDVIYGKKCLGRVELSVPGIHNVVNALGVIAALLEADMEFGSISGGLKTVSLPRRRFECVVKSRGVVVISDYAHHPSEIRSVVKMAGRMSHKRLLMVYQPHRFTRTLALGKDFPASFSGVDDLILLPVYAASERPLKGGQVWDLYSHCRDWHIRGGGVKEIVLGSSVSQAWGYLEGILREGDVLMVTGAGDVESMAGMARDFFGRDGVRPSVARVSSDTKVSFAEPLGGKTTMGVGGNADVFIEAGNIADLKLLLSTASRDAVPVRIIGAGSNVLVSDLGVRGMVIRLSGCGFGEIVMRGDNVRVGAGVPLVRLLDWLQERGLGGLEFLEGVPGSVGGAVRMNAGAFGGEIGSFVKRIEGLTVDGLDLSLEGKDLIFSYRSCSMPENGVIASVDLSSLACMDVDAIRSKRKAVRDRRQWLIGSRSAGSVFKNPHGGFAGEMIEKTGMKGRRVGRAVISSRHANVIIVEDGSSASDVEALIEIVRSEVADMFGVELEREIVKF